MNWWAQVDWSHAGQVGLTLFAIFCFSFIRRHNRAKYHRGYRHERTSVEWGNARNTQRDFDRWMKNARQS